VIHAPCCAQMVSGMLCPASLNTAKFIKKTLLNGYDDWCTFTLDSQRPFCCHPAKLLTHTLKLHRIMCNHSCPKLHTNAHLDAKNVQSASAPALGMWRGLRYFKSADLQLIT
jgi:hypothetical protein